MRVYDAAVAAAVAALGLQPERPRHPPAPPARHVIGRVQLVVSPRMVSPGLTEEFELLACHHLVHARGGRAQVRRCVACLKLGVGQLQPYRAPLAVVDAGPEDLDPLPDEELGVAAHG